LASPIEKDLQQTSNPAPSNEETLGNVRIIEVITTHDFVYFEKNIDHSFFKVTISKVGQLN
jgi:hypothetical protein